jgi:hypothetical protein
MVLDMMWGSFVPISQKIRRRRKFRLDDPMPTIFAGKKTLVKHREADLKDFATGKVSQSRRSEFPDCDGCG